MWRVSSLVERRPGRPSTPSQSVRQVLIVFCGWGEKIFAALAPDSELGFRIAVLRAGRLVRIFRLMRLLCLGFWKVGLGPGGYVRRMGV